MPVQMLAGERSHTGPSSETSEPAGNNTGLLQRITANVQNMVNTCASQHVQLSGDISTKLDAITDILNSNFLRIDEDQKKSFYNQNLICNSMET